ncbi:MAG: Gldg family protein [Planctomycetota bacterium]
MDSVQIIEFSYMLVIDMMFLVALVLLMLPLGIWRQAAYAVMKRNFIGYFSNPTGYVFLCLFVLLTSFAAFWPHEFFTTNLANFDQLNKFLPYIMLIFIPAITMGIWAEERRQGTDELLLTLPAKDFDIVIGKYFAAVLVFTVSLLFSQISNYGVLLAMTGGRLDNLLLFSTYLGYWFMGIAMISLGMVASFLTYNLTVGFIIGAVLNAPLAFFSNADVIFSNSTWIQRLFEWSLLQRFEPFGRGLINLSSIFYFLGIVVIGIYLSLILIGRRHWLGGRDGTSLFWHYIMRAAFVAVAAIATVLIVQYSPLNLLRTDISDSKISTLAPTTRELLDELAAEEDGQTITIEAYVGNSVPSEYVKVKYDLVNLLREFDVLGGNRLEVNLHQGIEPFSEEAILAEKKYGIRPVKIRSQSRGAVREQDLILGVAFSSGLERIVLPFLAYGMPVEYELMRSIDTVSKSDRKTIGVIQTDSLANGAVIPTQERNVQVPRLRILSELEKQYKVEAVDISQPMTAEELWIKDDEGNPIRRRYDVMISMQPSHSTPDELNNLINMIQLGQPVAIFEDPLPNRQLFPHMQSTFLPRQFRRNGAGKADIQNLWSALELEMDFSRRNIPNVSSQQLPDNRWPYLVWQLASENPYPRNPVMNQKERLVVHERDPGTDPRFSGVHSATQFIDELYFQFAGYIKPAPKMSLNFEPMVKTGSAGRVLLYDLAPAMQQLIAGNIPEQMDIELDQKRGSAARQYTIAAHIYGNASETGTPKDLSAVKPSKDRTNVVYVADVDTLSDFYIQLRDDPIQNGVEYRFQNMSFVLNIIDSLADEETLLSLRNRRVEHVTLEKVTQVYEKAMNRVYELDQELAKDYETKLNQARMEVEMKTKPLQNDIQRELKKREDGKPYDAVKLKAQQGLLEQEVREQSEKFQNKQQQLENERRDKKRRIDLEAELEIQQIQRQFKLAAVIIPPIPPLLVGLIVFTRRRLREREGISKARRLK